MEKDKEKDKEEKICEYLNSSEQDEKEEKICEYLNSGEKEKEKKFKYLKRNEELSINNNGYFPLLCPLTLGESLALEEEADDREAFNPEDFMRLAIEFGDTRYMLEALKMGAYNHIMWSMWIKDLQENDSGLQAFVKALRVCKQLSVKEGNKIDQAPQIPSDVNDQELMVIFASIFTTLSRTKHRDIAEELTCLGIYFNYPSSYQRLVDLNHRLGPQKFYRHIMGITSL